MKGGLALAFAAHEMSVARKVAQNSKSPLLQKLDGGMNSLSSEMSAVGAKLKRGSFNAADIQSLDIGTRNSSAASAAAGRPIKDVPVAIPGL